MGLAWAFKFQCGIWVSVDLIDKIFDCWIRDLKFNFSYTKNWLVFWSNDKELSSGVDIIDLNSLSKKKKKFQCVGECYSDITLKYECVNFMSHEDIAIWFNCCSQVGVGDGW